MAVWGAHLAVSWQCGERKWLSAGSVEGVPGCQLAVWGRTWLSAGSVGGGGAPGCQLEVWGRTWLSAGSVGAAPCCQLGVWGAHLAVSWECLGRTWLSAGSVGETVGGSQSSDGTTHDRASTPAVIRNYEHQLIVHGLRLIMITMYDIGQLISSVCTIFT